MSDNAGHEPDPLWHDSDEPIHRWFSLSYAQYLTIPRSVLQSMPVEWQRRFVACLQQLDEAIDWMPEQGQYRVQLYETDPEAIEDYWVREIEDPLMDYERGRRRIPLRSPSE